MQKLNDKEIELPIHELRLVLGDEKVNELCREAFSFVKDLTADEAIVVAEMVRVYAEVMAWTESQQRAA
jgi:hypothetical protein